AARRRRGARPDLRLQRPPRRAATRRGRRRARRAGCRAAAAVSPLVKFPRPCRLPGKCPMYDRFQTDPPDEPPRPLFVRMHPGLPWWLERRLLRPGEEVAWVRGPRLSPWWERHVTHPALFLLALAVGGACVGIGKHFAGSWRELPPAVTMAAAAV